MTCSTCNGRGKVWHEGSVAQFMAECESCNGTGQAATPMTAPTTGADETLARHTYERQCAQDLDENRADDPDWQSATWDQMVGWSYHQVWLDDAKDSIKALNDAGYAIVPATAVPDAELAASVKRLKEISEYASAVLILEGDFGRSTAETKRLTALLDARTLPHDWERTDAWLKHLAGDAARTEEGG